MDVLLKLGVLVKLGEPVMSFKVRNIMSTTLLLTRESPTLCVIRSLIMSLMKPWLDAFRLQLLGRNLKMKQINTNYKQLD